MQNFALIKQKRAQLYRIAATANAWLTAVSQEIATPGSRMVGTGAVSMAPVPNGLDICRDRDNVKESTLHQATSACASRYWSLVMNRGISSPPKHTSWKTLYKSAILETNKNIIAKRVCEAEEAVLARGREIFYGSSDPEEKEALEDALYALRAYKTAWQHTEAA
jgi:hypothetical protein